MIKSIKASISEKILIANELNEYNISIKLNQQISIDKINEKLFELEFNREDFVSQPGEFSVRGGIIDVFSFSNDMPYRMEFFGDEITRIRTFDVESQLSENTYSDIKITSNINSNNRKGKRENIFNVIDKDTIIFTRNLNLLLSNINSDFELSTKYFNKNRDLEDILFPEELYCNKDEILISINRFNLVQFDINENKSANQIEFNFIPQPSFNKSFNLLIDNLNNNHNNGYKNLICCTNKQQQLRLNQIFSDIDVKVNYSALIMPISSGFIDNDNKIACYTDHQIFERYHKFKFKKRYKIILRLKIFLKVAKCFIIFI